MTSKLQLSHLETPDGSRLVPVANVAEMNGGFSFRNKIVDGRFDFWYEGTSQTTSGYGSDTIWKNSHVGSTKVHSQQPLVAGVDLPAIEVPTAKYFSRTVVTSVAGSFNHVAKLQNMEGVGTLAGKTVTISFYAKADAVKNIALTMAQVFGTGGSSSLNGIGAQLISLSTTWKRYTAQITLPSISGKTIGTVNDCIQLCFWFDAGASSAIGALLGQQSGTFDLACVQLEEGSIMTPFEELPTEINLARVNRYYERGENALIGSAHAAGYFVGCRIPFRQYKRAMPVITYGAASEYVNIGTFNHSFGQDQIRQYVSATATGNTYISREFIADARL